MENNINQLNIQYIMGKREGIKEFFRPTKAKIILWIILFVAFPWKEQGVCTSTLELNSIPICPNISFFEGFFYLLGFFWFLSKLFRGINYFDYEGSLILPLITMLVVSYLLSCLLVFIFEKIKKQKRL